MPWRPPWSGPTSCTSPRSRWTASRVGRQRVWLAMVLAQATPVLLLDEPTSFLDIAHQLDVLDLVRGLCDESGTTVVMVLHDLAMAARYADHLIAMRDGKVVAEGAPSEVVTPDVIEDVFGVSAHVITDPETGTPVVIPAGGSGERRRKAHPGRRGSGRACRPRRRSCGPTPAQFPATVVGVDDLGAGMRRVTCQSPQLRTFVPLGPDEYVGLPMPPAGRPLVLPDPEPVNVRASVAAVPEPDRPALRWYTIRDHDPVRGRVEIDIMTHGDSGPGSAWTCRVRPGDPVGIRAAARCTAGSRCTAGRCSSPTRRPCRRSRPSSTPGVAPPTPATRGSRCTSRWPTRPCWRRTTSATPTCTCAPACRAARSCRPRPGARPAAPRSSTRGRAESDLAAGARRVLVRHGADRRSIYVCGYWKLGQARP